MEPFVQDLVVARKGPDAGNNRGDRLPHVASSEAETCIHRAYTVTPARWCNS